MNRFAVGLVASAGIVVNGPVAAQTPPTDVLTPLQVVRVERALEGRIACLGCHRIDGRGGLIGPSLDGLSERADYEYALAVIRDPIGTVPGTIMPHQPMPDRDAERLARYIMSLAPSPSTPGASAPEAPPALTPADTLNGAALYARHCAACHGASGAGDGWNAGNLPVMPTAHSDPTLMSARPDDTLYDAIAAGGYVLDKSSRMPAFGELLRPDQILAIVEHLRVLCDCEQPVWANHGG